MNINWKELFKQENTVFYCETEETANELLSIAHSLGYEWSCGESYLENNFWYIHGKDTCYDISCGKVASIGYEERSVSIIKNTKDLLEGKLRKPFKLKRK